MPDRRKGFLIFIMIFFRLLSSAQPTIFEHTEIHQQIIQSGKNLSEYSNQIIVEIARSASKSPDATRIMIDFTSMIRVKQIDSLNYSIFCELKEMRFSGDIYYRNIDISDLLIPDVVDFSVSARRSKPQSEIVFSQHYSGIPLYSNLGYFTILTTEFRDTEKGDQYSATISNISLSWGKSAADQFEKHSFLINEYFKSGMKINELHSSIRNIDLQVIEKVAFNNIVLRDIEKDYEKLIGYDFMNQLNLWKSDPVNFSQRMSDLKNEIDLLRFQINAKLDQLDRLYYDNGLKATISGKPDSAAFFFRKAVEYNPFFVPALNEIARLNLRKGILDTAARNIIFIQENTYPAEDEISGVNKVTLDVITAIQESVQRKIANQDFVEAEHLLELAIRICINSPQTGCFETMDKLMAQVKYGLYKSILTVVEKASENKRFEIAWIYIQNALSYQKENRQYIITPIETEKYYNILFSAVLRETEQLNSRKQFVRALELAEWTESLCDTVPQFNCEDIQRAKTVTLSGLYNERLDRIEQDILKKNYQAAETRMKLLADFVNSNPQLYITQRYRKAESDIYTYFYLSTISEAESNIEYGFFEPAWKHLLLAKEIQETHFLKKHNNMDMLFQVVVNPVLFNRYDNLIRNNSKYSVLSLETTISENNKLIKATNIILSDSVIRLQNKLDEIVNTRLCDSISSHANSFIQQGEHFIQFHQFIDADSVFRKALEMSLKHTSCNLSVSEIEELRRKLSFGVQWENALQEMQDLMEQQRWREAILKYSVIDELSSNQYLFMWGVERNPLPQYISEQRNTKLILEGFEYFYEIKQYDNAFLMLDRLRLSAFPVIQTLEMQKRLGNKLAIRDKIQNPKSNFKINILKYTEGEEYFLYFSTSYRKTWRKY